MMVFKLRLFIRLRKWALVLKAFLYINKLINRPQNVSTKSSNDIFQKNAEVIGLKLH